MSEAIASPASDQAKPIGDAEAAAVMVMLLGDAQAARLLSALDPAELQLLGEKMCALGDIGPDAIIQAIAGFTARTENLGFIAIDRVGHVGRMMKRAVGEVKARNMMQRILPGDTPVSSIELARWLNAPAIVPLIKGEHPQAVAVLLIQLDPTIAAEVLATLPAAEQTQVVHRIATMGPVLPEALEMLEELLNGRIGLSHGKDALKLGGPRQAADIINNSGKAVEKRVMPELAKLDKLLARRIEEEMFKFEHLFALDAQSMGALLREIDSDVLIDALKGIEDGQRDVFFRAMSSRAADGVKDEIAARGRLKMAEAIEAQRLMVAAARRLSAEGAISFGAGGGNDEYV